MAGRATRTTDRPIFKKSPGGALWYSIITGIWCHETTGHKYLAASMGYKLGWALGVRHPNRADYPSTNLGVFERLADAFRFVDKELTDVRVS